MYEWDFDKGRATCLQLVQGIHNNLSTVMHPDVTCWVIFFVTVFNVKN